MAPRSRDGVSALCVVSESFGRRQRRVRAADARRRGRRAASARAGHARAGRPGRTCDARRRDAVGRTATARRAGARARDRAEAAVARRAAGRARCRHPSSAARRDPRAATRVRRDDAVRHARPGRGTEHGGPRRDRRRRPRAPGRHAARPVRAARERAGCTLRRPFDAAARTRAHARHHRRALRDAARGHGRTPARRRNRGAGAARACTGRSAGAQRESARRPSWRSAVLRRDAALRLHSGRIAGPAALRRGASPPRAASRSTRAICSCCRRCRTRTDSFRSTGDSPCLQVSFS